MKLCDDGHDEVCFEGGYYTECPMCLEIGKSETLEGRIEELEQELDKVPPQKKSNK